MSSVCPGAGQRTAFTLVSAFIVLLLLVTAASAGWPDLNGDWSVNVNDFAIFANAWRGTMGNPNWDPRCDIWPAVQGDGIIDEEDLKIMCDNWLAELPSDLNTPGATLQVVYYLKDKFFEGATWDPNSNKLFFTNMTSKQILRLDTPGNPGNAYTWMNDGSMTNGMFLGIDGRLLTADQTNKRVRSHRIGTSGPLDTQVLCTTSDPPNDLCQLTNGDIYMTCQNGNSANQGVYLFKNGTLTKVNNNTIIQPNGIIASLDETKLYVSESSTADNSKKRWWVYPINANGTLGTGSIFFQPANPMVNNRDPDGMTIDERGNLYLTGLGGLYIVSPTGQELRRFPIPEQSNNVTFGGADYKTLYIACQDKIYSLAMEVHGGE
jgi:gluconolactonase